MTGWINRLPAHYRQVLEERTYCASTADRATTATACRRHLVRRLSGSSPTSSGWITVRLAFLGPSKGPPPSAAGHESESSSFVGYVALV